MRFRLGRWMVKIERVTPLTQARDRMDTRGYRKALNEVRRNTTERLKKETGKHGKMEQNAEKDQASGI